MSNGRRPTRGNRYRSEYLKSPVWHQRRDHWLDTQLRSDGVLRCAVCQVEQVRSQLELHHVDYAGVTRVGNKWTAGEHHDDLVAVDRQCHEALHRLLDTDRILRWHRTRRVATTQAIAALRRRSAARESKGD